MSKKTKVAKIVIDLNGERLELSPDQAKELRDILCDLYGETVIEKRVEHHHHDWPYRQWYYTPSSTLTWSGNGLTMTSSSAALSADIGNSANTVYLSAA